MKRMTALVLVFLVVCGLMGTAFAEEPAGNAALSPDLVVDALRSLGIHIPDEMYTDIKADLEDYLDTRKQCDFAVQVTNASFAADLLIAVGQGVYDYEAYAWTPTSSDVYAFDAEVFDVENMYRLFLQGVEAIVPGFSCGDVQETLKEGWGLKNLLIGGGMRAEGVKMVSFRLNGNVYQKDLNYYHDWFDESAVAWINDVLAAEGFPGRLYMLDDGYQGIILIYGDQQRADALASLLDGSYSW